MTLPKPRKIKPEPKPAAKSSGPLPKTLAAAERIQALIWTEDKIALLQRRGEIVAKLMERHSVSERVAVAVYTEAMGSYRSLWLEGRPERATMYERQLQGLFRLAVRQNDLSVADRILGKMGRMWGVEGAIVVEQTTSAGTEFSDRTDADLEHFTLYGSWPAAPSGGEVTH